MRKHVMKVTQQSHCPRCQQVMIKAQRHHVIYRSAGGSNSPDNLIRICEACHKALHSQAGDFASWGKIGGEKTQANFENWFRCWRNLAQFKAMPEDKFTQYVYARALVRATATL